MKKIVLSLLMLAFAAAGLSPLSAHGDGKECPFKSQASADEKLKTLAQKLSLDKEQQSRIKPVIDESMATGQGRMTAEECASMNDKIMPLLNDKQRAKYEKMCAMNKGAPASCCPAPSKTK